LPGLFQPGMHIALFTISETLIFPCRIIDAEHRALLTSQKLRDLGWKPRKLEEMLTDSVECYEKAGLLRGAAENPCHGK
jgi:nucleoside-diphosphate-sugar epimerase